MRKRSGQGQVREVGRFLPEDLPRALEPLRQTAANHEVSEAVAGENHGDLVHARQVAGGGEGFE